MLSTNTLFEKEIDCNHENLVTDEREGTVVCINCGLVIEDRIFLSRNLINEEIENKNEIYELLFDFAERFHIVKKNIDEIIDRYQMVNEKIELKFYKKEEVLVFCIYENLNKNNISLLLEQILIFFPNVRNEKKVYEIETLLSSDCPKLIVEDSLIHRCLSYLDFSFKQKQEIVKIFEKVKYKVDFSPKTIIGSIIYMFCKCNKLKIQLKNICNVCEISQSSVNRALKRMPYLREIIEEK